MKFGWSYTCYAVFTLFSSSIAGKGGRKGNKYDLIHMALTEIQAYDVKKVTSCLKVQVYLRM